MRRPWRVHVQTGISPLRSSRLLAASAASVFLAGQRFCSRLPRRLVLASGVCTMAIGLVWLAFGNWVGVGLLFIGRQFPLFPSDRRRPWWADLIVSLVDRWRPPPAL